ncbi:MAG: OmpA family protein [Candidatus Marinimicrobia bacterium]|nr:OmpA family protein [Candidatus Neomarinimicrobiota bacterium]
MPKIPEAHDVSPRDNWMITYGSLLTGVLAFFLLLVGKSTSEAESIFKFSDNLTAHIGKQIDKMKQENGYDWLYVENTGNKGIKLLIPSEIQGEPIFYTASADINSGFLPILNSISEMLNKTDLSQIDDLYSYQIEKLKNIQRTIDLNIRIEGHTDQRPIRTAVFRDNWDLSTARAYSVMQYFQNYLHLDDEEFSLAGYASFHPLHTLENYDENRRVEIYIKINTVDCRILNQ